MALSLQLGYPQIPKSITNPNVNKKDALDMSNPLPFLTFIKLINVSFEPDSLQNYYNYYIKSWNSLTVNTQTSNERLVVENYRDFLKEITLNYTTLEEKQYLSKIDFNDPYDLDIAMGFYGRKLREITQFYNNKRNDIKFNLVRNKIKGTNYGSEKTIIELTLNYLKGLDDGKILYDYESAKAQIEVEIEELFDTYPLYFNQTPDSTVYDKMDLDYGMGLFIKSNDEIITEFFSDISTELKELKELDDLFNNKRKLTQKNVFTNFFYLSTGNTVTNFLSGQLFESNHAINAFTNRDYPTSASTEQDCCIETPRKRGFFRPLNTSIVLLDGVNGSYSFNFDNLTPNTLYYFPDPNILGHNGDVITFVVDDSFLKKHVSSGNAVNQPASNPYDTKYYGYVSKNDPNIQKNLDIIFDQGYIKDSKRDIYGNLFGLFNNEGRFESHIEILSTEDRLNMIINGHIFYDDLYNEGFAFNYLTFDETTFTQTLRTGLSSYTGGFLSNIPEITLYPGPFTPYITFISPTENVLLPHYTILEGAYLLKSDNTPYPETYSSDLSTFEYLPGEYYFDALIECGVSIANPYQRALLDPSFPSLTANMTQMVRTSALQIYDGGWFGGIADFDISLESQSYGYSGESAGVTEFYAISNLPMDFYGKIMVRNSDTRTVDTITNTLPYLTTKYNAAIVAELEDYVEKFEVSTDILFIETSNYLVIDKIKYSDSAFSDSKVSPTYLTHNTNWSDKISNRFKLNNGVFYVHLYTTTPNISSNTVTIYPRIYRFDTVNFKNDLIYNDTSNIFEITNDNVLYSHVDPPTLTYNSRNNIFKLSYLLKDQNNTPTLFEYDFNFGSTVEFLSKKEYSFNGNGYSNTFEIVPPTFNFYMTSNPILTQDFELIL